MKKKRTVYMYTRILFEAIGMVSAAVFFCILKYVQSSDTVVLIFFSSLNICIGTIYPLFRLLFTKRYSTTRF